MSRRTDRRTTNVDETVSCTHSIKTMLVVLTCTQHATLPSLQLLIVIFELVVYIETSPVQRLRERWSMRLYDFVTWHIDGPHRKRVTSHDILDANAMHGHIRLPQCRCTVTRFGLHQKTPFFFCRWEQVLLSFMRMNSNFVAIVRLPNDESVRFAICAWRNVGVSKVL